MPHIKSNVNLEKSFGKFSTSYLSESKQLEMKIEKTRKEVNTLFIISLIIWISCIVGVWTVAYQISHSLNGKI